MTADFVIAQHAMARARPEESLVEFAVREYSRMVYRIAYSVLRNPAEAEDAVQDLFLRMLRYENKMKGIESLKAWVARIAWRVAVERRGRLAHESTVGETASEDLPSKADGADDMLLDKERGEALERLIATLPDQLQHPLLLATIEELEPCEVAAVLGISEAAVRSRAFRARQILKKRMATWMGAR